MDITKFEISGIITTLSKQCDFSKSDGLHKVFDGVKNCAKENCDNCIYYAEISSDDPKNIVKGRWLNEKWKILHWSIGNESSIKQ